MVDLSMPAPTLLRRNRQLLTSVLLMCLSASVSAGQGISLELGTATSDDDVDRFGIAYKRDWNAQWFTAGDWYLGGHWELGASYWDGKSGRTGTDGLGDFHITPVLQFQRKPGSGFVPFLEFGLGAHVHTDTEIGDKDFDIPFAFGSHVGAGLRFGAGEQYELVYRYQHLSNASLGDDNPGINFHVLQLGYRY